MLAGLHIGNFKAFKNIQHIPLRRLNILFGPNSGGKSSIIHSLLLASHAAESNSWDVKFPSKAGKMVDLGGYHCFVHRTNRPRVALYGDLPDFNMGFDIAHNNDVLKVHFTVKPESNRGPVWPTKFVMPSDDEIRKEAKQKGDSFETLKTIYEIIKAGPPVMPTPQVTTCDKSLSDIEIFSKDSLALHLSYKNKAFRVLDIDELVLNNLNFLLDSENKPSYDVIAFEPSGIFRLKLSIKPGANLSNEQISFANNIASITNLLLENIKTHLSSIFYLGPFRTIPHRQPLLVPKLDDNWFSGGDFAWELLRNNTDVLTKINKWLSNDNLLKTPYVITMRRLIDVKTFNVDFFKHFYWLWMCSNKNNNFSQTISDKPIRIDNLDDFIDYLHFLWEEDWADVIETEDIVIKDKTRNTIVSNRDIGIGISQVIPVLVASYAFKDKIIAIEQPEIHLHPALQAELADVFIETSFQNSNQYLLETHSEHIILRVMKRLRQTYNNELPEGTPRLTPEDVSLIYVEQLDQSSYAMEIPLGEDGMLLKAVPGGFFEEGLREVID